VKATLVVENPLAAKETLKVTLEGRGLIEDRAFDVAVAAGGVARQPFTLRLPEKAAAGRLVLALKAEGDGSDSFLAVDVEP
jgi:hypothetical protein